MWRTDKICLFPGAEVMYLMCCILVGENRVKGMVVNSRIWLHRLINAITGTTICQGLRISQETADEWLRRSIDRKYAPKVDKYSTYKWTQNEFDALVSFAYNIGSIDGLTASGSRSKEEIADKIQAYNKAGGKVLSGLIRRRQ